MKRLISFIEVLFLNIPLQPTSLDLLSPRTKKMNIVYILN